MVPNEWRRLQSIASIVICRHVAKLHIRVHERKHGGADMLWQVGPSAHDAGEFGGKVDVIGPAKSGRDLGGTRFAFRQFVAFRVGPMSLRCPDWLLLPLLAAHVAFWRLLV